MIRQILAVCILSLSVSGCAAMSANSPVSGFAYTSAKGATAVSSNDVGSKTGQSCATSILGIVGLGDASIASAAKAGGITKVSTVDSENTVILGVWAKNCTVVTGN